MKESQPRRKPRREWRSLRVDPAYDAQIAALAADLGLTYSAALRRVLAAGLTMLEPARKESPRLWASNVLQTIERCLKP